MPDDEIQTMILAAIVRSSATNDRGLNILVDSLLHEGPVGEALNETLDEVIENILLTRKEGITSVAVAVAVPHTTPEDLDDFQRSLNDQYHHSFLACLCHQLDARRSRLTTLEWHSMRDSSLPWRNSRLELVRDHWKSTRYSGAACDTAKAKLVITPSPPGLADRFLMQEVINQNVLAADSLKSAFERMRQAGGYYPVCED
ncbi:hypothetical protein E4U19_005487 [Claviceps sp. Clav32 group G5]|nr:hypothetical protein E4U19_005487 [Claviceps sp. Clav32 group G5]